MKITTQNNPTKYSQKESKMDKTPDQSLEEAADVFRQRNEVYGSAYLRHGDVMEALFPKGLVLLTKDDWNRLGVFNMMVSKMVRYAHSLHKGGHQDSALDLIAYSAMLESITDEQ